MSKKRLLIVTNVDWFFISHRIAIAEEALKQGYEVIVAAENTGRANEIEKKGIRFVNLSFSRSGTNIVDELSTILRFYLLYRKVKPDVVHQITLKPVIYGSIVSRFTSINGVVNAISGLGYNFTNSRLSSTVKWMIQLMRYGFKRKNLSVIFQNKDDYNELKGLKILSSQNTIFFIKGSGVNLNEYHSNLLPETSKIKILFPSRMLWDKGVKEVYEAALELKKEYYTKIEFILAGLADENNKAGVPQDILESWQDGTYLQWIGYCQNMKKVYEDCHIVILPSYREGMPKSLIEAAAMGRALITTDAIGCKECVDEGVNGLKVPVGDAHALALAIRKLVDNPEMLTSMGKASRMKAEKEFDIVQVVNKHLEIYNQYL